MARRVRDWLSALAKEEIAPLVRDKTQLIERPAGRITIRDTKSRWGSCSHDGNLSFCWGLVMAPASVLDYVVAHEVAHLRWNDHGPGFWGAVARFVMRDMTVSGGNGNGEGTARQGDRVKGFLIIVT